MSERAVGDTTVETKLLQPPVPRVATQIPNSLEKGDCGPGWGLCSLLGHGRCRGLETPQDPLQWGMGGYPKQNPEMTTQRREEGWHTGKQQSSFMKLCLDAWDHAQ